jgi:hypothetical protein
MDCVAREPGLKLHAGWLKLMLLNARFGVKEMRRT